MNQKIQILHFWTRRPDAELLIRQLASGCLEFEARLVSTHSEYVSALVRKKFDCIIAVDRAEAPESGNDSLTLFQIAEQISPGIPFVQICETDYKLNGEGKGARFYCVPKLDITRIERVLRKAVAASHSA